MKMNESYLHVKIWMNLTKITVRKRRRAEKKNVNVSLWFAGLWVILLPYIVVHSKYSTKNMNSYYD